MTPLSTLRRIGPPSPLQRRPPSCSQAPVGSQHARSAWPFAPRSEAVAPLSGSAMPSATATSSTHDRVPVDVNAATIQELGIRLEVVGRESLTQETRAVATVVPDESRISHVHTRVAVGRAARRQYHRRAGHGWSAARPHLLAGAALVPGRASGRATEHRRVRISSAVIASGRTRLTVLGMAPDEIDAIEQSGEPRRLVTVVARERRRRESRGDRRHVGRSLHDAAHDCGPVARLGARGSARGNIPGIRRLDAAPRLSCVRSAAVCGTCGLLYPTLTDRTRTLRVRFSAANPGGSLRPGSMERRPLNRRDRS